MRHSGEAIRDIFDFAPGDKIKVAQLFVTQLLYNLSCLLPPIATSGIVSVITTSQDFKVIYFYVILYLIFIIIQFGMRYLNYRTYNILANYYYSYVQQQLFEHVSNNDSILEKLSKGKITDTCSEDVAYIIQTVDAASSALAGLIQLLMIIVIFASHNILIALIALAIDGLYVYAMNKNSQMIAKYYEGTRKYQDKIIDILNQMLGNLKQVKTLNMMPNLTKKLDKNRNSYDIQYDKKRTYYDSRYCKLPLIVYIGKILLYIQLAYYVYHGTMTIDTLVLLISYFEMVIDTSDTTLEHLLNVTNYAVRITRIKHILNFSNETSEIDFGDIENDYINGIVTFDNVSFETHDKQILKNVSFKAMPNEITAIVGKPGSGKTTIINLLYRLYRIKSGSIMIDDESAYNYTKKVYSSNVSGVFQKAFVFKMSIKDNLALVDNNLKHQQAALRRVGLLKEIEHLPYGINTIIDEENPLLTDGQLQKLAIARAILSRAEILLFDEVTSSVDPDTMHDIVNIIKDLKEDHTIIIITHNPELMKAADQIVVLSNGKVVAKGKNKEVFAKSALYRELQTAHFNQPSIIETVNDSPGYTDPNK